MDELKARLIEIMTQKAQAGKVLYCSDIEDICNDSCCDSCHEDESEGWASLFLEKDDVILCDSNLCCSKIRWVSLALD